MHEIILNEELVMLRFLIKHTSQK